MAYLFKKIERRVIPNWRSFKKTVSLGEINPENIILKTKTPIGAIKYFIDDWKEEKTIASASELLSAAFVNNIEKSEVLISAAEFILKMPESTTEPQKELAEYIIHGESDYFRRSKIEEIDFSERIELYSIKHAREKINRLKKLRNGFPYNPIVYVDLARMYNTIGQNEKATYNLEIAYNLAPENRFVLRTIARHLIHIENIEEAHDILRKSRLVTVDPWLATVEITLAMLRNRHSRFIKRGFEMIDSNNFSPFSITELASTLGTLELISGGRKNSKKLFRKALIAPNDNSLAQVEWAINSENLFEVDLNNYKNVNNNYEAIALDNYHEQNWELAYENSVRWFFDLPFSSRPVMFGAHIAATILDDHKGAIRLLNAGLVSNPNNESLLNNIAYSLAKENRIEDAKKYIDKIYGLTGLENTIELCVSATKGLVLYKEGKIDEGRKLYLDVIEKAKGIKNHYYNWLAILNLATEELIIKSGFLEQIMDVVKLIPKETGHIDIDLMKKKVEKEYVEIKNK